LKIDNEPLNQSLIDDSDIHRVIENQHADMVISPDEILESEVLLDIDGKEIHDPNPQINCEK
jgi:hypothetical protein